jgi:hypothetical protein
VPAAASDLVLGEHDLGVDELPGLGLDASDVLKREAEGVEIEARAPPG